MENKTCKYLKCGKEFTPNHGKQLYCSVNCKAYYCLKNKQSKKAIITESENGFWVSADGRVFKEWDVPTATQQVEPLRFKIKTVKDQPVPERLPVESSLDYRIRCEEIREKNQK